ncbi:hypothetical protein PRUPE_3G026300 [Prunus persica]|uniref:Uncharacterized protein n=1 Tax=Prunus persica TaxID=3760 RepID=A0A251PVH5_PRUPE|nr:hypothetical protein PRUPE_3G026300 [Prunus persica]
MTRASLLMSLILLTILGFNKNNWFYPGSIVLLVLQFLPLSVVLLTSAHSTRVGLEKCFASPNQNRILQLRSGDSSIADYLDKVNVIADNLTLSGSPIPDSDLLAIIMNNVGPLYESIVASAQACETPITYADLEALLLFAEQRHLAVHTPTCDGHVEVGSPKDMKGVKEIDGQKSCSRFDWALPLERQNGGFLPRHRRSRETCSLSSDRARIHAFCLSWRRVSNADPW